ncbi:TonB-dependent siderophore receptor [Gluconacetobacter sp. Hr-1-5]|uniref:TonB-dependent siderophore receptor n=1 Tax=Gluconacetobacter sp. Hr-1-5 TaxID=3395370 RepID=UPI003B52F044
MMLALGTSLSALGGSSALAQQGQSAAPLIHLDIPRQPLSSALQSFSSRAGVQVVYTASIDAGVISPGISGDFDAMSALSRLLLGTGVIFRQTGKSAVVLSKASAPIALGPVRVQGQADDSRQADYGPNQGFVDTSSNAGTKTSTPLIETPQSISVITRAQMEAQAYPTAAQLLQYVPGVATGTRGGYDGRFDYVMMRGFNESIQGDYRDGLRQNVGLGSYFSYFGTEPYGLDRIDVVRGPSSVAYGQNAPGGIIDRVSKTPTDKPFSEVEFNAGSDNWYQGKFDFSGPISDGSPFSYRLTGLVRDGDLPFPRTKNNRIYIAPAFKIKIDKDTTLTILTNYEKDQTGVGTVARAASGNLTRVYLDDPSFSHFNRQQAQVGYRLEHRFNDYLTARQNFRWGFVDTNYSVINQLSATGETINRYSMNVQEGLDTYALDNQLEGRVSTGPVKHTAVLGFDYFRSTLAQGEYWDPNAPSLNLLNPQYNVYIPTPSTQLTSAYQQMDQYGLYLQDQMKWKRLVLVLSGRQDWAVSTLSNRLKDTRTHLNNSAETGRAAILYESSIGLSPYASVSSSFVPNLGVGRSGDVFTPTTGLQEEVGVKYKPRNINSFTTLSLYNIDEKHVLVTDPVNTAYQTETGKIRSRGVEVEERADLGWGLSFIGTFTYDDVKNIRSNPSNTVNKVPIAVPSVVGSAWLDYTRKFGVDQAIGVGGGFRYTGPTFSDAANTIRNPTQTYFDLRAHYDIGRWRVQINANNIAGRRLATCYSTVCTMNEDRFVLSSIRYRF